jgi:hypothetical protein
MGVFLWANTFYLTFLNSFPVDNESGLTICYEVYSGSLCVYWAALVTSNLCSVKGTVSKILDKSVCKRVM